MNDREAHSIGNNIHKIANWHITLFIFLVMQTCAAVWWASNVSSSIEYLKQNALNNKEQIGDRLHDIYTRISRLEDNILKK